MGLLEFLGFSKKAVTLEEAYEFLYSKLLDKGSFTLELKLINEVENTQMLGSVDLQQVDFYTRDHRVMVFDDKYNLSVCDFWLKMCKEKDIVYLEDVESGTIRFVHPNLKGSDLYERAKIRQQIEVFGYIASRKGSMVFGVKAEDCKLRGSVCKEEVSDEELEMADYLCDSLGYLYNKKILIEEVAIAGDRLKRVARGYQFLTDKR
tara:strand:- start:6160 stop:6777 length:618 start_codon:yes stop_codon:yes gene_type:complete